MITITVNFYPPCDLCAKEKRTEVKEARYSAYHIAGGYYDMCPEHFLIYGKGLGLGKGQRMVLQQN